MTISEIQQTKRRFVVQSKSEDSFRLGSKIIESLIQNNVQAANPEAFEQMYTEAISCITYGLKYINDAKFDEFIQENIVYVLRNQSKNTDEEVNFIDRLESRYYDYPQEYEYAYKTQLASLLKKSPAIIGNTPLNISLDKPSEQPTVANWLTYYEKKNGKNYTDSFKRSQFLASDEAVQNLDAQGRQDIQNLLTFMDYLQEFPSLEQYVEEAPRSIESLSPPQPAKETMSREILETPSESVVPQMQSLSQQPPTIPNTAPSAAQVMSIDNQLPNTPPPPVNDQNPPQFLGQEPTVTQNESSQEMKKKPATVDLSKVKLPNTKSQTIDLKNL